MTTLPKTGRPCHCKPGLHRDNCPDCEGTGRAIDWRKYHAEKRESEAPSLYTFDKGKAEVIAAGDYYAVRVKGKVIPSPQFRTIPQAVLWYSVSYKIQTGQGEAIVEQRGEE